MNALCKSGLALAAILLVPPATLRAELITNGSFETPTVSISDPFFAGDTRITGWTIGGTSIDLKSEVFFHMFPLDPSNRAFDGRQLIDLEGTPGPGSVSQTFATVPGEMYQLSFAYSRNIFFPEIFAADPSSARVTVTGSFGTLLSQTFETRLTGPLLIWTPVTLSFVGDGPTATLTFASNNGSGGFLGGVVIDAVSVQQASPVPEPTTAAVWLAGAVGLLALRRSRRTVAAGAA